MSMAKHFENCFKPIERASLCTTRVTLGEAAVWAVAAVLLTLSVAGRSAMANEQPDQPNVLMIVVDTLRADHLGCYGHEHATSSHIDDLAARGIVFARCYSTSSWTMPAVASMLSGLLPSQHGATTWTSKVDNQVPWLPEKMQAAGFHTMAVSSNPFLTRERGINRGFDVFDDQTVMAAAEWSFPLLKSKYKAMVLASTSATATRRAMELLLDRPADKPFFFLAHYMDPHADYAPPPPWDTKFDSQYEGTITGHAQSQRFPVDIPPRDLQHVKALYDGEIAHTDASIGQLLEHVDALGLRKNTWIIVTSDHGEEFLEHGQWFHGHTLFEEAVRVPLIIVPPSESESARGLRIKRPVSLVDLAPTLASLLGLEFPSPVGVDLSPCFDGKPLAVDQTIWMETDLSLPLVAMVRGHQKVIARWRSGDGEKKLEPMYLFDLQSNPSEKLQEGKDAARRQQEKLAVRLAELWPVEHRRVSKLEPSNGESNQAQLERLRSLGYLGEE